MASQVLSVEVWNLSEAASPTPGTRQGYITDWSKLIEVNREDGNDTLTVAFPMSLAIWASITQDWVVRVVGEDGRLTEYPIYIIEDDPLADLCTLTCAGIRSVLGNAANAIANTVHTWPGSVATMASGISPVGLTISVGACTGSAIGDITTSSDTNLSFLGKIVSAVDATLASGVAPCVMKFTPTISAGHITGYVITIVTTVAAGTVHLLTSQNNGKNVIRLIRRRDKTDPIFPLIGYQVTVADRYRDNPSGFPYDNLKAYETCRLEHVPLGIDTTIRMVAVTTDHSDTIVAVIELGTPKRRLQQTVAVVTAAAATIASLPPPNCLLNIVPQSVTSSQAVMRVYVATPAVGGLTVTVTYSYAPGGASISPGSGQTLTSTTDITTTGYVDFTITRDQFGTSPTAMAWRATANMHLDGTATTNVETVADLASATKSYTIDAATMQPTDNAHQCVINTDGSIQSASGVTVEQYRCAATFPDGVTVTQITANLTGNAQMALLRGDNTAVGSACVGSGGLADVSQSLSEVVGTGTGARYSLLLSFNGGGIPSDRMLRYVTLFYTSPNLQNTL